MPELGQIPVLHLPIVGMAVSVEDGETQYIYSVRTPSGTSLVQVNREMFEEMLPTFLEMAAGKRVEVVETGPMGTSSNRDPGLPDDIEPPEGDEDEDGFSPHGSDD